ncbi:MAG: cell wall-binding repeat-containing protein [Coriobacteriia bacterium]|nr:cell wall-binding repeat-containing protein [Coriobacteriia bacterium]
MGRFRFGYLVLGALLASTLILAHPVSSGALQPPRPGELEELERQGLLDEAVARARAYGNDQVAPGLLQGLRESLGSSGLESGDAATSAAISGAPLDFRRMPSTGIVKIPAIIIDFADHPSQADPIMVQSMLSGNGVAESRPTESLRNYYLRSSYGLLDIRTQLLGVYHYPYQRSSVSSEVELVQEAFRHFDNLGHDFAQYDADDDGWIDYAIVFWSGPKGAWSSFWWGHWGHFSSPGYRLDGKGIRSWSWQWEPTANDTYSASVLIHETGHALGLPDLYDYKPGEGPDGGVGVWDVMHVNTGDHNAFSKWMLGWLDPLVVSAGNSSLVLRPSGLYPDAAIVTPGYSVDDPFREFFLVQTRNTSGNDDTYYYPEESRLNIWHFDATLNEYGDAFAWNNSYTSHKFARVVEADGMEDIEQGNWTVPIWGDFYGPGQSFTPLTFPNSNFYGGLHSGVSITNIARTGSNLTFTASIGSSGAGDGNNDIPGVSIPPSPVSGSLDEVTDRDDVYSVYLRAGQTINTSLTGAPGTDFDMALYAPGTTTIVDGTSVAVAQSSEYPDQLSYTAQNAGTYYLRVYSYSGSGAYTLTYSLSLVVNDDDIPGVPIPASPVTGSLDKILDERDVFSIPLRAGQILTASITGPAATDFDMELYSPSAISVFSDVGVVSASGTTYPDSFTFTVQNSGTYYLELRSFSGNGAYTLTYTVSESVARPRGLERLSGTNRYDTCAKASRRGFRDGSKAVVIATGENWPDALGGAALAGVHDAPILLTKRDSVPAPIAEELLRLNPSDIFVLGGEGAVSWSALNQIANLAPSARIQRFDGSNRHETTRSVAERVISDADAFDGTAFVATGLSFPDALAAAPISAALGRPLFLSEPHGLPSETLRSIDVMGVSNVIILGGTSAVPRSVETQLRGIGVSYTRVSGSDRYETAVKVARRGVSEGLSWNAAGVASGAGFADALSGGAMLGRFGSVMMLTPPSHLHADVNNEIVRNRGHIDGLFVIGGEAAVSRGAGQAVGAAAGF